jgi:hypothetical protein
MQAYAAQLRPAIEAPSPASRMAMDRRDTDAVISGPVAVAGDGLEFGKAPARDEYDPALELEVPAFLRRSEG